MVRWIRQVRGGGTQMGIELIAPHCTPCAIKLLRKTEHASRYLRALWVPEVSAIDRPATIITARLPFEVNNKVQLMLNGKEMRAHLVDRVASTGSYSQFEHHLIGGDITRKSETDPASLALTPEDDFDSLWKSL